MKIEVINLHALNHSDDTYECVDLESLDEIIKCHFINGITSIVLTAGNGDMHIFRAVKKGGDK